MVVLNRIYTRTGDDGTTALGSGERRKKYDLRIRAYGTLDEVNAVIGLVRLATADDAVLDAMLARIQNDLFDVEADLCMPQGGKIEQGRAMAHSCSSSTGVYRKRDTGHFKSRRFERSRPIFPGPAIESGAMALPSRGC